MMIQNLVTLKIEINHQNISDSCQKFILFPKQESRSAFWRRHIKQDIEENRASLPLLHYLRQII